MVGKYKSEYPLAEIQPSHRGGGSGFLDMQFFPEPNLSQNNDPILYFGDTALMQEEAPEAPPNVDLSSTSQILLLNKFGTTIRNDSCLFAYELMHSFLSMLGLKTTSSTQRHSTNNRVDQTMSEPFVSLLHSANVRFERPRTESSVAY